jgi:hypothetical protein
MRATLSAVAVAVAVVGAFSLPCDALARTAATTAAATASHSPLIHAAASTNTSLNWAGYVAVSNTRSINFGVASWIVPAVTCPATGHTDVSVWIGQGGDIAGDTLFQTGTSSRCDDGVKSYGAWWEQVPGTTEQDYPDAVAAGDYIQAYFHDLASSPTTIELSIADFGPQVTSNIKWEESVTRPSSQFGYSMECVVERPRLTNGSYENLADFKETQFVFDEHIWDLPACEDDADIGTIRLAEQGQKLPAGMQVIAYSMVNQRGASLATPSGPSATGAFTVTWIAAK